MLAKLKISVNSLEQTKSGGCLKQEQLFLVMVFVVAVVVVVMYLWACNKAGAMGSQALGHPVPAGSLGRTEN